MDKVDQAIERANQALDRVKIFRRNRKLALRGSLPCRFGKGRGNRQQTIALGIYANPAGVKVAIARAQRLESDLNLDRFDWADWGDPKAEPKNTADWGQELATIRYTSFVMKPIQQAKLLLLLPQIHQPLFDATLP